LVAAPVVRAEVIQSAKSTSSVVVVRAEPDWRRATNRRVPARFVESVWSTRFSAAASPWRPERLISTPVENWNGVPGGYASDGESLLDASPAWQVRGDMVNLGTLGGEFSVATSINVHGQVVGHSETESQETHAFRWDPDVRSMRDLGTLGGKFSYAQGVNDQGDVVGFSQTKRGEIRAFVWLASDQTMHDLGSLGGANSRAASINNLGLVVGLSVVVINLTLVGCNEMRKILFKEAG